VPEDLKLLNSAEYIDYDENGKQRTRIRVQFKVGDHGPFIEYFDKASFQPASVNSQLRQFADKIRQLGK
jgi:hypothetical protein